MTNQIRLGATLLIASSSNYAPVTANPPEKSPVKPRVPSKQLSALIENAFSAIWIDSDLGEADLEFEVRAALDAGVSPNARNRFGETLLLQAIENQRFNIIQMLLRRGANPNLAVLKNSSGLVVGETPLIRAVAMNDSFFDDKTERARMVRWLLERGALANQRDESGNTALLVAAIWGRSDVVPLLLKHGADQKLHASSGQTALQLAAMEVGRGSIFIPSGIYESERENEKLARQDEERLAMGRAAVVRQLEAAGAK